MPCRESNRRRGSGSGARFLRWLQVAALVVGVPFAAAGNDAAIVGATVACDGEAVTFEALGAPMAGRLNLAFGDSFTSGVGASSPAKGYVPLVSATLGWGLQSKGLPGRQIQDIVSTTVYPKRVTPASHFTTLTGVNDLRYFGTDATALGTYRRTLEAGLAWLAIPHSGKVMAADAGVVTAGVWAGASVYADAVQGRYSGSDGATARLTLAGTAIYVGYTSRAVFGHGGSFTVAVDGAVRATVDTSVGVNSGQPLGTFWPELVRIGGLAAGSHEVVVTVQVAAGNFVNLEWFGSNGSLATSAQPLVLAGTTPRLSPAGYAKSAATGYNRGSDAAVQLYNEAHREVCANLAGDGLHVFRVDVSAGLDPADAANFDPDNVHPSDLGYARIAALFLSGANGAARQWGVAAIDPGSAAARIASMTPGAHGSVTAQGTSVTYSPGGSYFGRDVIGYSVVYPARVAASPPGFVEPAPFAVSVPLRNTQVLTRVAAELDAPVPGVAEARYGPVRSRETGPFLGVLRKGNAPIPAIFAADGSVSVQVGDAAPGLAETAIIRLGAPSGETVLATLRPDSAREVTPRNSRMLLSGLSTGPLRIAAREGQEFSNAGGVRIRRLGAFDGNGSSCFFLAAVQGSISAERALCATFGGYGARLLVWPGQQVGTRTIRSIATLTGAAGTLAEGRWRAGAERFGVRLTFTDRTHAIYEVPATAQSPADWTLRAATGDPVPEGRILSLGLPGFGRGGAAAVAELSLELNGQPAGRETAVISLNGGAPTVLARAAGDAFGADGVALPAKFRSFGAPVVGAAGRVAFLAMLRDGGRGIWLSRDAGPPRLLVRVGEAAPGGGEWARLTSLALPDDEESGPLFTGQLALGAGVVAGTRSGLWGLDRFGAVRLLLRTGQTIDLREGPARVVTFDALSIAPGSLGSAHGMDDTGVVSVQAKFDNQAAALVRIAAP